ncbi:MAG TPA: CopG family transcriptional regulator [Acidobacteriota bacterium]|nr:CopG family transcriptional regulator [Acidobacteriota bacterium]
MRTTLDIDDDILQAAKELAKRRKSSAGKVLSDWAREALTPRPGAGERRLRNGVPVLPEDKRGGVVTLEAVNRLRDEEAD